LPPATTVNCSLIEGSERDTTQDWLLPRGAVPTVSQLEARIDEAVVIAKASEEGVREVGEMAIDAARQARRAAEAAEASAEAAAAARDAAGPAGPVTEEQPPPPELEPEAEANPPTPRFEERFRRFSERADSVSGRLRRLCEQPGQSSPSVGAARRRGDG
jgi:hypothetical protein